MNLKKINLPYKTKQEIIKYLNLNFSYYKIHKELSKEIKWRITPFARIVNKTLSRKEINSPELIKHLINNRKAIVKTVVETLPDDSIFNLIHKFELIDNLNLNQLKTLTLKSENQTYHYYHFDSRLFFKLDNQIPELINKIIKVENFESANDLLKTIEKEELKYESLQDKTFTFELLSIDRRWEEYISKKWVNSFYEIYDPKTTNNQDFNKKDFNQELIELDFNEKLSEEEQQEIETEKDILFYDKSYLYLSKEQSEFFEIVEKENYIVNELNFNSDSYLKLIEQPQLPEHENSNNFESYEISY